MFFESDFELRTKESHDEVLAGLESGKQVHVRGVKTLHCQSSLNRSFIFHSTKNKTFGGMHVLLEGVVPYETSCVLSIFINVLKIMTLDELNKRMRDYPISTIPPVDGGISRDRSNIIGNWSKNCLFVHRPRIPRPYWDGGLRPRNILGFFIKENKVEDFITSVVHPGRRLLSGSNR